MFYMRSTKNENSHWFCEASVCHIIMMNGMVLFLMGFLNGSNWQFDVIWKDVCRNAPTPHTNVSICTCSNTVVLNRGSESRMRLPSTTCATLSSLSIKPVIFCVTDFVLLQNVSIELG